jgi:hypothetical protein
VPGRRDGAFAELVRNELQKAVNTSGAYPFTWQTVDGFTFFLEVAGDAVTFRRN